MCQPKIELVLDLRRDFFSFRTKERSYCSFKYVEDIEMSITDIYAFKLVYMEMNDENKNLLSLNRKKPCSDSLRSIKEITKQMN